MGGLLSKCVLLWFAEKYKLQLWTFILFFCNVSGSVENEGGGSWHQGHQLQPHSGRHVQRCGPQSHVRPLHWDRVRRGSRGVQSVFHHGTYWAAVHTAELGTNGGGVTTSLPACAVGPLANGQWSVKRTKTSFSRKGQSIYGSVLKTVIYLYICRVFYCFLSYFFFPCSFVVSAW